MYEMKTGDVYEDLAAIKEYLISVTIQLIWSFVIIKKNQSWGKWKMKPEVLQLHNLLDLTQRCNHFLWTTILNIKKA